MKRTKSKKRSKHAKKIRVTRKSRSPKQKVYDVGPKFEEKARKFKNVRRSEIERTRRIIWLALLLALLIILMYIGAEVKGNFIASKCVDTDNGVNPLIPGHAELIENGIKSFSDTCTNSTTLKEFYCNNGQVKEKMIECKNGCVDGHCSYSLCTDTDGGVRPESRGICFFNGTKYIDRCLNNRTLIEYFCDGSCASTEIRCTYKCADGACVMPSDNYINGRE